MSLKDKAKTTNEIVRLALDIKDNESMPYVNLNIAHDKWMKVVDHQQEIKNIKKVDALYTKHKEKIINMYIDNSAKTSKIIMDISNCLKEKEEEIEKLKNLITDSTGRRLKFVTDATHDYVSIFVNYRMIKIGFDENKYNHKDILIADSGGVFEHCIQEKTSDIVRKVRDHIKNFPFVEGWDVNILDELKAILGWREGLIKIVAGSENNSKTEEILSQGDIKCRKTVEGVGLDVCESSDKRVVYVLDEIRYEKEEKQK